MRYVRVRPIGEHHWTGSDIGWTTGDRKEGAGRPAWGVRPDALALEGLLRREFSVVAKEVGEGIESLSSTTGLNLNQMLSPLKGGVVFAAVPDEHGKIDDERSMVVVAKARPFG